MSSSSTPWLSRSLLDSSALLYVNNNSNATGSQTHLVRSRAPGDTARRTRAELNAESARRPQTAPINLIIEQGLTPPAQPNRTALQRCCRKLVALPPPPVAGASAPAMAIALITQRGSSITKIVAAMQRFTPASFVPLCGTCRFAYRHRRVDAGNTEV